MTNEEGSKCKDLDLTLKLPHIVAQNVNAAGNLAHVQFFFFLNIAVRANACKGSFMVSKMAVSDEARSACFACVELLANAAAADLIHIPLMLVLVLDMSNDASPAIYW